MPIALRALSGCPHVVILATLMVPTQSVAQSPGGAAPERIVGGRCEGCEAVFQGLPPTLTSEARIAPEGEPGEPLVLEGTVRTKDGRPAPGIVVYAYQTDAAGIYPSDERFPGQAARRHGRLRAWARSGADGRYRFLTIRPASYPNSKVPQHIHVHVLEPGRCTYYIDDVMFDDDPHLTPRDRAAANRGRGGPGLVRPVRGQGGAWGASRDIALGQGISGYEACAAQ